MEHALALDQGTSATKALIVRADGVVAASAVCPLRSFHPKPDYVEQDAEEILASSLTAVKNAVSEFEGQGHKKTEIVCAGISNQRESFLIWDKSGKALTPVIVWQDKRASGLCESLAAQGLEARVNAVTGLRLDPYFSGGKLRFLMENGFLAENGMGGLGGFFGTIDSFLLFKLCAGSPHLSDYTNASRTLLMDIDALRWDASMRSLFCAGKFSMAELRPSASFFGKSDFGGVFSTPVPITACIGDSHAAAFGEGCFYPGTVKATMGTGSSVMFNTGKRVQSSQGLVSAICWSMEGRVDYALEGVIVSCASTLNWALDVLKLADSPAALDDLAESAGGSEGVTLIPAFSGLGAPYWQMSRRAEILGLTFGTTAAHIARAALEAYPFQLKDVLDAMKTGTGTKPEWIRADGGLTNSRFSMNLIARLLRLEVRVDNRREISALGAALLAFLGNGTLSFSDIERAVMAAPFSGISAWDNGVMDTSLQTAYSLWSKRVSMPHE
ncbi:MAG: carbohydrate kinase [Spirochaetaceae bacterium]|jgi:glycerol kinase|nr:carbohydrate kinase [Spirochaetaceae bacterium]